MNSSIHKKRTNVEVDRLSSLPDDLIHKILSFISIKHAIETSALSSRWRFIWKSMPYLNFSSEDFSTLPKFSKFVKDFLSGRIKDVEVSSVKLSFRGKVDQRFVKTIREYAFSHNVQEMTVTCLVENNVKFPLSHFNSKSLKHLSLIKEFRSSRKNYGDRFFITPMSTWELPELTTLYLHSFTSYDDNTDKCIGLFSSCPNLKNLTLKRFKTIGLNSFTICHCLLSNLTLEDGDQRMEVVKLETPQLKNLTIINWPGECQHLVSAPDLASLVYKGYDPMELNTDGFHSLEKVDLCVSRLGNAGAHKMVCLLQQLHSVKSLTLNLEIVELLSSSNELISYQPSPFANLKSLTIYPEKVYEWELLKEKVTMSSELKNYLLDGSPGATLTMVSREEAMVVKNVTSAQNLMTKLRVLLEEEKANTETNGTCTLRGKAPMESPNATMNEQGMTQPDTHMQLQIGGSMAQIKSCWEDLSGQIERKKDKARLIIAKLHSIEELLTKLPTSNRAMIQPCFSSLCAQADVAINKITDCMKIQCDENQSRLNVYFHELATTLRLSS